MSNLLSGRYAVITGANQGLGLAIARAYVAAGANVLLCARDTDKLKEAQQIISPLALTSGQWVEIQAVDVS